MKVKYVMMVMVALCFVSIGKAEPTVWLVHPDSALNTIQAGLDSCTDNDIVLVCPGTYVENIVWPYTQGIHLISEQGPEVTIIDGNYNERIINMSIPLDSTTLIRGFTIQHGGTQYGGSGIFCYGYASPTITENIITRNFATGSGGGICVGQYSSPIITWNTITYNTTQESGGGICVFSTCAPTISNNTISNNTSMGYMGGGIAGYSPRMDISSNTISNNISDYYGGGIALRNDTTSTISDNTITGNTTASGGGGIYLQDCQYDPPTLIKGNIISDNISQDLWGGGIMCINSSPIIKNNTITENSTNTGDGAGIAAIAASCPDIDSCCIALNFGDGLYCVSSSNATVNWCDIYDNSGYGVYNDDSTLTIDAENNWWDDSTGPYHPDSNPGGLGDSVSDYVDFIPWLNWPGVEEQPSVRPAAKQNIIGATIFAGPLVLPKGKNCKVFDITGRKVLLEEMKPGIYFIEVDGKVTQKVIKVR
jgi:parallel beta-helix repeat protein